MEFYDKLVIAIVVIFVLAIPIGIVMPVTPSGSHTGIVTAVEQDYFPKKYRVYFKTDSGSSQEDIYCVEGSNKDLADRLTEAAKNKQPITINYGDYWNINPFNCGRDAIKDAQ